MNIDAFTASSTVIQIHALTAIIGFIVGSLVVLLPKGVFPHKLFGRLFALAAIGTAFTSFFIHHLKQFGPFSWIHILSIFTLVSTFNAIYSIRKGNVKAHKINMLSVYIGGFIIAGGFTFLPGRLMHTVFLATN